MTDAELIQTLGGATALAKKLGLKTPNGARRVHNWKTRGIPAEVRLNNPRVFKLPKPNKGAQQAPEPTATQAIATEAAEA